MFLSSYLCDSSYSRDSSDSSESSDGSDSSDSTDSIDSSDSCDGSDISMAKQLFSTQKKTFFTKKQISPEKSFLLNVVKKNFYQIFFFLQKLSI